MNFPKDIQEEIQADLILLLDQIKIELLAPRVTLAFLENDIFNSDRFVRTDSNLKVQSSHLNEGLIGLSVRRSEIVVYPTMEDGKKHFLATDARSRFEIAGPIVFKGKACAALFIDFFEGESIPEIDDFYSKRFSASLGRLSSLLEEGRKNILSTVVRKKLSSLIKKTNSRRGYVAIKNWDGRIELIKEGDDVNVFIDLNEHEGLCGYVFQTGKRGYIPNTKNPPAGLQAFKYVSSDKEIKTEIVYPFKDSEYVIGLLNLESVNKNSYKSNTRQRLINETTQSLLDTVVDYRENFQADRFSQSLTFGRMISNISRSFVSEDYSSLQSVIIRHADLTVLDLKLGFSQSNVLGPYYSREELNRSGFGALFSSERSNNMPIKKSSDSSWIKPVEIRILGESVITCIVEQEQPFTPAELQFIERLERLGSVSIFQTRVQIRSTARLLTLSALSTDNLDLALVELPQYLSAEFDCEFVTIFMARSVNDSEVGLFPIASSGNLQELNFRENQEFYRVDSSDGLTGHAATLKHPSIIRRFKNNKDLSEQGISIRSKGKIVEKVSDEPKSFAAIPVYSPSGIKYLIRFSRFLGKRAVSFTEEDENSLIRIKSVFENRLSSIEHMSNS